jgi:hypothetical protein
MVQDDYETDLESITDDGLLDISQESIFDEILEKEEREKDQTREQEPPPMRYALGMHWLSKEYPDGKPQFLVASTILAKHWFAYQIEDVLHYLRDYSIVPLDKSKIEIMRICEQPDFTMQVILKTHWLRLIQRTWRNVVSRREELRHSFHVKRDDKVSYGLKGMLSRLYRSM